MSFFKSLSNLISGKVGAGNLLQNSMFELDKIAEKYKSQGDQFLSDFYKYLFSSGFSYAQMEFENKCELPSKYASHVNELTSKYYMQLVVILHLNYYLAFSEMENQLQHVNMNRDEFVSIIFNDIGVEENHFNEFINLMNNFHIDNLSSFWVAWVRRLMVYVYGQEINEMHIQAIMSDLMIRAKVFNSSYEQLTRLFEMPNPAEYNVI